MADACGRNHSSGPGSLIVLIMLGPQVLIGALSVSPCRLCRGDICSGANTSGIAGGTGGNVPANPLRARLGKGVLERDEKSKQLR